MRPILAAVVASFVLLLGALPLESQRRTGQSRSPRGAPTERPEGIRFSRAEVAQAKRDYRDVLHKLAAGDRGQALEGLSALEQRYVNPRQLQGTGRLGKVQAEVIHQLSRRDPELMLPILQLHLEATRTYTDRREWYLANHSRRLAGAVAESYAEGGGSQGARVMASRAFTTLGGTLQEGMASESCRCVPFYERALHFDPSDEAARLGLATVFEKASDYERAAEELNTLVGYHPENHEARLRLAINLKRTARDEEAEAELVHLTKSTDGRSIPQWIVSLAYQERVRSLLDRRKWTAAENILEEARRRLPNHQRLTVLHAFVLEQTRRPKQAQRVLAALQGEPLEANDTPRLLYTRMPEDLIRAAEEALRQGADSRLSLLKTALERVEGGMW